MSEFSRYCKANKLLKHYENYNKDKSSVPVSAFVMALLVGIIFFSIVFAVFGQTDDQIADAIYLAEGGELASKPYGILSVFCEGEEDCRVVYLNTIRNNRVRYADYGYKEYDTYLEFLASRYAPIGAENDKTGLNFNWLTNVQYFP